MHNNEQQHYDGFHTLRDNDNNLVLCNTSLFCSSGFNKECNTKGFPKVNKCRQQKFKKWQRGEQNLIYLTNWPFAHPPNATNFNSNTKMLIIKPPPPPPFDDDEQRQQCTCLNAISYSKQITTSYSFPSHRHNNNNMSEKQQQRDDVYVVIPQLEYSRLYNGQYAQLTDLRKSADPDGQSSTYLETTLKTHYPKVYLDMIKNNYILTAQE